MNRAAVLVGGIGAVCLIQAWVATLIAVAMAEEVRGRVRSIGH